MISVTFTELRNHAKRYFDAVEKGQTVEIYRKGKPVAVLSPLRRDVSTRWKSARPLKVNGVSLSKVILAERSRAM